MVNSEARRRAVWFGRCLVFVQDVESRVCGQGISEVWLQASDVPDKVDVVPRSAFFDAGQSTKPNYLLGLPDWDPEGEDVLCDVVCDGTSREVCAREIESISALSEWFGACVFVST